MFHAPKFWYRDRKGIWAQLLRPIGAIYAYGTAKRLRDGTPMPLNVPVICVGNINAGGTGKTPTVIAVIEHLREIGLVAQVVTRGFGGSTKLALTVDPRRHTATQVGDEPLLLSAFAEVHVAPNRQEAAKLAIDARAEAIIMDDGHQNPSLAKDLNIVVVDAAKGFGNGLCIPAGPLREPIETGLARADLLISIGSEADQDAFKGRWGHLIHIPHLTGHLAPLQTGMDWSGLDVVAFAGIGHPEKFFDTLRGLGANVLRAEALGDHETLSPRLLSRLLQEARAKGAQLVTTEKDAVRLPNEYRHQVITLPVRLQSEDWSALDTALQRLRSSRV